MQNREAAEHVLRSLRTIADEISSSIKQVYAFEKEGKVSNEELNSYCKNIMGQLDQMLTKVVFPLYEIHPDLCPKCACCNSSDEDDECQQ